MLQLFGVVSRKNADGTRSRGDSQILQVLRGERPLHLVNEDIWSRVEGRLQDR